MYGDHTDCFLCILTLDKASCNTSVKIIGEKMIVIDVNIEIYQNKKFINISKTDSKLSVYFWNYKAFSEEEVDIFRQTFYPVSFYLNASLIWFLVHFSHFDFSRGVVMSSKTWLKIHTVLIKKKLAPLNAQTTNTFLSMLTILQNHDFLYMPSLSIRKSKYSAPLRIIYINYKLWIPTRLHGLKSRSYGVFQISTEIVIRSVH